MSEKLRVGVLLDSLIIPAWAHLMLEKIKLGGDGELVLAAVNELPPADRKLLTGSIQHPPFLYKVYRRVEDWLSRPLPDARALRDAGALLQNAVDIKLHPEWTLGSLQYPPDDIEQIGSFDLDVLIYAGRCRLSGEILSTARLGLWRMSDGGTQKHGFNPPGFWEVFENQAVTCVALSQARDDGKIDRVLYRSYSATDPLAVNRNFNRAYWKGASFAARKLRQVRLSGEDGLFDDQEPPSRAVEIANERRFHAQDQTGRPRGARLALDKGAENAALSNWQFTGLLGSFLLRYAANRLVKLCFHTQWHLLYHFADNVLKYQANGKGGESPQNVQLNGSGATSAGVKAAASQSTYSGQAQGIDQPLHNENPQALKQPWPGESERLPLCKTLSTPRWGFWSDPFVVYHQEGYHIFFEEFVYREKKAHISVLEIDGSGIYGKAQVALERPYHLSYPFIFECDGDYYMIPETAAHRTIEVYRCREFPLRWEFCMTLMENVVAMDTTLFSYEGRWWMFANIKENAGASSWDELFLFWAEQPLTQAWNPHPRNPVISDVRRSRPAGNIFMQDGALFRPSQDSSQGYGFGININRISVLNINDFHEEVVDSLHPGWDRRFHGLHTLNFTRDLLVVDAKSRRLKFSTLV